MLANFQIQSSKTKRTANHLFWKQDGMPANFQIKSSKTMRNAYHFFENHMGCQRFLKNHWYIKQTCVFLKHDRSQNVPIELRFFRETITQHLQYWNRYVKPLEIDKHLIFFARQIKPVVFMRQAIFSKIITLWDHNVKLWKICRGILSPFTNNMEIVKILKSYKLFMYFGQIWGTILKTMRSMNIVESDSKHNENP